MSNKRVWYDPDCRFHPDNLRLLCEHFELADKHDSQIWVVPPTKFTEIRNHQIDTVVATNATGDRHIGLSSTVVNLADEKEFLQNITSTAEHTFGLILALTRHIVPASQSVLNGEWNRYDWPGEKMLSEMSLGIVGYGRLGRMVGNRAASFGMRTFWYDPQLPESDPLDDVLQNDLVTFHCALNDDTKGMVSWEMLSKFKQGAYLINTSHGDIIDTEALLYFLESGHLTGAALDCVPNEFDRPQQVHNWQKGRLLEYARKNHNLLITPHIGGSTKDAWYMTQRRVIEKLIERYGDGSEVSGS